jgi:hypothetical protein
VEVQTTPPPPPDVLADLRRWREDVAHLLALRAAAAQPAEAPPPPQPDAWLAGIAKALRAAQADGAVPVTDDDGWLVLIRPDGRRTTAAPGTVEQLAQAGLLPDLPEAVGQPGGGDPDVEAERIAERGAIQAEPRLPPPGTPARAALDQRQAEMVAGLLESALVRPPCFEGEASRPPPKGSYCSCCKGGRRWWFPRRPKTDGTGPDGCWRCLRCRPPARLSEAEIVRIET